MRALTYVLAAGLIAGTAGTAAAQNHTHAGHAHGAKARAGTESQATSEFTAAHERMMRNMGLPYTGDPDVDFRVQMIPHHQGAIDMARVALRHAKDPWTRQLAESVIVEQQREIAEMQAWLARGGVAAPTGGQPLHIMGAESYRSLPEEPGTRAELVGKSWAPGGGVPVRRGAVARAKAQLGAALDLLRESGNPPSPQARS